MSTLKVSNINNASASSGGLAIDSSGVVTGALPSPNRNLLYNGAMQVHQRGTSTTGITVSNYYTADRWILTLNSLGTWTQTIENDAPTGSGFRKSLKVLCTTADAAPAAADHFLLQQILEGQDVQRIKKGTSDAEQMTLSFWVKSNVTGTYVAALVDSDNTRICSSSYTVSASNTWEKKTITFPADTTGALDNDNDSSLRPQWLLAAGSDWTSGTLNTTWASTVTANRAVGQTNLAAATNNYWQVTGVQLEVGPTATPFEFKSYGQELRECQRYYYLHVSGTDKTICNAALYSSTNAGGVIHFPTSMRTGPVLSAASGTNYYTCVRNVGTDDFNSLTIYGAHNNAAYVFNNTEISGTAGHAADFRTNNAASSIAFSAEL